MIFACLQHFSETLSGPRRYSVCVCVCVLAGGIEQGNLKNGDSAGHVHLLLLVWLRQFARIHHPWLVSAMGSAS